MKWGAVEGNIGSPVIECKARFKLPFALSHMLNHGSARPCDYRRLLVKGTLDTH